MANSRDFTGKNRKFTGTKGIVTPKGTTGERVGAESGELRFNTTTQLMEYYDGTTWKPIDAPPTISNITTNDAIGTGTVFNADGSTLFQITINGGNFSVGCTVQFIGNTGTTYSAGSVNRVSASQITCNTIAGMGTSDDPYDVRVTNTSGLSATLDDAFSYNAPPVFVTAAGSLGNVFNSQTISGSTFDASATDAEGNTITYSIVSGSLPGSGLTLSSSTGLITGTLSGNPAGGVYVFTVRASTTEGTTDRQFSISVIIIPAGGTIVNAGDVNVHTFNSSGSFSTTSTVPVDVLVVGGGGGGAGAFAGGGGAGGVVYATSKSISPGTYTITVGEGGLGGLGWQQINQMRGNTGDDSVAFSLTAKGGGGGGSFDYQYNPSANSDQTARPGGSGGGGGSAQTQMSSNYQGAPSNQPSFAGATSYGNAGGNGNFPEGNNYNGGGGGGAGGAGGNGTPGSPGQSNCGPGGAGQAFSITGSSVTYAGGGGASTQGNGFGTGGSGGGGNGTQTSTAAQSGGTNLGGGGGAGGYNAPSGSRLGGSGGKGVVIVKYNISALT